MTDWVWVTFQREGIHKYPAALTDPALESVRFLGFEHRHMFHFRVWIEVHHDDRDREFIMEKRWMEGLYGSGTLQLDYAGEHRKLMIEVSEDGENGCLMEFTAE
jgi:hypothetical protein